MSDFLPTPKSIDELINERKQNWTSVSTFMKKSSTDYADSPVFPSHNLWRSVIAQHTEAGWVVQVKRSLSPIVAGCREVAWCSVHKKATSGRELV